MASFCVKSDNVLVLKEYLKEHCLHNSMYYILLNNTIFILVICLSTSVSVLQGKNKHKLNDNIIHKHTKFMSVPMCLYILKTKPKTKPQNIQKGWAGVGFLHVQVRNGDEEKKCYGWDGMVGEKYVL